jgi:glycogen synthase
MERHFSWRDSAQEYLRLYEQVCSEKTAKT